MDIDLLQRTAIGAAYKSAKAIRSRLGGVNIRKKGAIDLVTEADIESENIIVETILERFPDHSILAEESGIRDARDGDTKGEDNKWVIDPLDGTTNFAHQLPFFSVSIAYVQKRTPIVGVVLNPETGELFTAMEGKGAERNGQEIRVSESKDISDCLLATGFPYNLKQNIAPLMKRFESCIAVSRGIRRFGSAALDLCYLACGRFDGFWEQNLKPWDTAAGELIAREAGATITDFTNSPFTINDDEILATNGHIHAQMISLLELK
jgi:myo-inositol-1(or 4)-monophosphatase